MSPKPVAERRFEWVARGDEHDVREQQQDAPARESPMPQGDLVKPAERPFDRSQQRREDERAREQQNGLDPAQSPMKRPVG